MTRCSAEEEDSLVIASSANMQFAIEKLVDDYSTTNSTEIELVIGSSGKLTAQIEQGAPFDLFIAANTKYPHHLFEHHLSEKPVCYAFGKLILWTMNNKAYQLSDLVDPSIRKVGIPNPKTAPYGEAAIEALQHAGIYESVKDKLVYAESVSQVNQFISSKSVDVGFTALSVVYSQTLTNIGSWVELETDSYPPIQQDACILKKSKQKMAANSFMDYLLSQKGTRILKEFGYTSSEK